MQNLAASANLQLFSKALQESAQQAGDMPDQQQNPAISAADLQQFMLSQLDQQFYLSQLAGYGNGGADNNNGGGGANALFSLPQQPVSSGSSDSATTTVSSGSHGHQEEPAHKQSKASSSGGGDTADSLSQRAQLVQQKLMEQFMEAATNGNASMEQQMNGGGGQQSDELSQLMAQLIGGTTAANGGGNAGEQLQHVQQQQNGGGGQQRGDAQSPSQQMSVLDQLQLLQMLGSAGGGGAALADLLAAGAGASLGSAAGLMDNGQLGQQLQSGMGKLQQQHHQQNGVSGGHHGHGGGGGSAGGSPAKDDTYCEICNKNVCNRYFLKIHLAKKHGIGTASGSPLKTGNGNFFGSGYSSQLDDLPARAQSASLQQHQQHNNRDSPSTAQHQQQQQRMSQKQSMSSTPGLGSLNGGHGANSSMNDSLSADQQLMSQCIMQQLAVQLELAAQSGNPADRPALIEQILNAGLPLAEMLQQQQQSTAGQQQQQQQTGRVRSSSPQSDLHGCAHCTKQFGSQSALFQHQLTEHIGTTEQQQQQQQAANDQLNNSLAGMRWPAELGGGVPPQQQQQILGQLLSSAAGHFPIPTSNPSSLLLSPFGQLNPTELDGAAMLAKLSAELAAVSQPQGHQQQPSLLHQNGALQTPLQVTKLQAQQPPPQKRQYSSTSKNFCDLCNKEVCNKYFLRTHMLKMHNIVIDENKVVIANIDTAEKERKGEVKFRCEICLTSLANRDQLRTHKREVHGMQAPLGGTLSTPPKAGGGGGLRMMGMGGAMETTPECRFTAAAQQQQTTAFPFLSSQEHQQQQQREHREAMMERQQPPGMLKFEPAATAANDENQPTAAERDPDSQQPQQQQSALPSSVKQLRSQLIGDPLLAPAAGRLSTLSSKRQSEEQQDHFQQQHPQQLPTQQRQISDNSETNNNSSTISCRFCGLCLESEELLQLHQLMDHMDLMRPEQPEDLITQVALQMAEANSHKASALRKSSAASSGASSSSAASSSAAGAHQLLQMPKTPSSTSAAAAATTNVPCPQCKRTYKSAQKMEQHQRIVHHSFMAKISPTKRPVISPKKIAKLVKGFSCMKCQRRFPTKAECNEHVITAHLRPKTEEDAADNSPRMKRAKMEESLGEEDADADEAEAQQRLLARWVREEQDEAASSSDLGRLVVDEAEEELEEKEENDGTDHGAGGGGGRSDQKSRPAQKQAKEGEKHSHTSGSTSPVSVHASSSGLPPEGFAHPAADHQKPFVLQSFTVRPVLPGGGGLQNAEPNGSVAGESALPDELIAYLPVRHTLSQPLRITLELQPNPQLDSEVRHL